MKKHYLLIKSKLNVNLLFPYIDYVIFELYLYMIGGMIMSKKFSTCFLLLLMICSLTLFVGCGKEDEKTKEPNKDNEVVDKGNEVVDNKEESTNNKKEENNEEKKVVLLKRNGVEWKENTSIKSTRGAQKYTVVWGDTLGLIARTWKVNAYKLASYNGIKDIDKIEVGQVIYNYAYKG